LLISYGTRARLVAELRSKNKEDPIKKATLILLLLIAGLVIFFIVSTLRCKSMAKDASSRVGYRFLSGCYIELSGERVPLK